MIETKFHLFQIQEKMTSPDPIIAPQFCFGEAPEILDAVDMAAFGNRKRLTVIDLVVPVSSFVCFYDTRKGGLQGKYRLRLI